MRARLPAWSTEPCSPGRRLRSSTVGQGWFATTPLVIGRDVVGVLYNDAALSGRPMDEGTQALAALSCGLVGSIHACRHAQPPHAVPRMPVCVGRFGSRALELLGKNLSISGRELASALGVSPSYFARRFKQEFGVTFVDYRARARLDRFREPYAQRRAREGLLDVALAAGFGSYSQFHRVHTRLLGESPRAHQRRVG